MAREVTLAFTDIEGSTARWERDRIAMQDAVRRHDAIIRGAIGNHRGRIFKTAGDAFCAVFDEPADAVAGMIEAQQRLAAEDFSAVAGLRVRAAVHTGVVEERESEYAGRAAGTIARLVAIGHGGQILLTGETAAVLGDALPRKASLHELGAYRLEEGGDLQRVYQLVATGLESNFPPLRSLGVLPGDRSVVDDLEFRSVRSFSGRQEELATLHAALKRDGAIAVVHGLGGVGKSSLAREYGRHYRDEYSILWWLNAESESGIVDGLLRLGATFVKGLDRLADRRVAAERVINSVLGGFDKPVLLVFDNLEDEGLMRTWLPRTGVRALATSRDSAWGSEIIAVPLDTWPLGTSAAYLRRASGRGDLSDADARAIVQALGALPLALSHAAAALRDVGVTPELYLAHVSEHLKDAPHEAEYPRSIFATFSTAIAQAEQHAAGAAALLCLASCFAPDGIPDELFRQAAEQNAGGLQPALAAGSALDLRAAIEDELCLDEALGALDRLSLLHFAPNSKTYEMHRLVQLAAQGLSGENAGAWRECAVAAANAAFPEKTDDLAAWSQCERLLPHARAALDALPGDCAFAHAGRLAIRCASYLWQRGEYTIAEQISNRGLEICERALGPDHPDVARSLYALGMLYWIEGRHAEATAVLSRALAIREKTLGPDHPEVAQSLNSLGIAYPNQAHAAPLFARAIAIMEKARGPDHPEVAFGLNNLGVAYYNQGRLAEAEPIYARALAIREKGLGPDHPLVAYSLTNLAMLYQDLGRYAEAERLNLRSVDIRERMLGPDHPYVAMSLNVLATMYAAQGRYADAERLHLRALAIREKAFGPERLDVSQSLNNLAEVYRLQERYAEAESLLTRALAIREKARGPDHPEVADSLFGHANVYRGQRRYEEAEPLLSRALAINEAFWGSSHPDTKAMRDSLDDLRRNR